MNSPKIVKVFFICFVLINIFISLGISQDMFFDVDYPSYLSSHDIVYLSPPMEGYEGFPVGNGDLGAMIWCSNSGFEIQINKNDTWDQPTEESGMVLRSCGRLTIEETVPCFNWLYLDDFEARLSLYNANTTFSSRTPFKNISAEFFTQANRNVFMVKYRTEGRGDLEKDGSIIRIGLERWGSRAFSGWYNRIMRDASRGLGNAKAGVNEGDIYIQESLQDLDFVIACRIVDCNSTSMVVNRHRAEINIPAEPVQEFVLMVAVVTTNESPEPLKRARDLLDECQMKGINDLKEEHGKWWADFWDRSFVHLNDDYLENLYYLHLYLMGSSSRGRYPVIFNAGIWTWNRDVRQWVTPHHWNIQQPYWSLLAANHGDLLKPYLDTYWRLVPKAEEYAESRGFDNAILWNESHDFAGRMPGSTSRDRINNFTPASQIGRFFWQYYLYTGDRNFLKEKAYPFIKKAAEFYLQYLKWDEDKNEYYIFPAQMYECPKGAHYRNTVTDLGMIRTSFRSCIEASKILGVDTEKRAEWKNILDHLAPYPLLNLPEIGEVVGLGMEADGSIVRFGASGYTFCRNTSLVFPSGDIGIDKKGTRIFEAAVRRAKSHPENMLAISPIAVVAARLGMKDETRKRLMNSINQLQHFPQGLFYNLDHWCLYSRYINKFENGFIVCQRDYINDHARRYENIRVTNSSDSVSTPMQPFIQCGLEPSSILAAAVNEMLLQSHEGKIRVFPASPDNWKAAFSLRASGGFLVSSERDKDLSVKYIVIKSLLGNKCRVVIPWQNKRVLVKRIKPDDKNVEFVVRDNNDIIFSTVKNGVYLIKSDLDQKTYPRTRFAGEKNMKPKYYKEAVLGKPRNF